MTIKSLEAIGARAMLLQDNKLMANAAVPPTERRGQESICLPMAEHDRTATSLKPKKRMRMRVPYVLNGIIAVLVLALISLMEFGYIPQTKLGYYCKDPSLMHEYRGDTISMTVLLAGSFIGPLLLFLAVETDRAGGISRTSGRAVMKWYNHFFVGVHLCLVFVQIAKVIIGEHRPHFLKTCRPDTEDFCRAGDYVQDYKCTTSIYSSYTILDSSRSFPSGHSALSVFTAIYCAVYVHYRFATRQLGSLFKLLLLFLCFLWAMVCSLTRIIDHRHHWWDVLIGTILGVVCSAYVIISVCNNFQVKKQPSSPRPSASTTTLLDVRNKDSTSVII